MATCNKIAFAFDCFCGYLSFCGRIAAPKTITFGQEGSSRIECIGFSKFLDQKFENIKLKKKLLMHFFQLMNIIPSIIIHNIKASDLYDLFRLYIFNIVKSGPINNFNDDFGKRNNLISILLKKIQKKYTIHQKKKIILYRICKSNPKLRLEPLGFLFLNFSRQKLPSEAVFGPICYC